VGWHSGWWGLLALCLGVANTQGQGNAEAWGGTGLQQATAVSVDAQGNAWVVGFTDAANFPTLNAAFAYGGEVDAFIVEISPSGNVLLSTYLGGAGDDRAAAVGLDATGNVYVAGTTTSTSFDGVPLSGYAGDSDGFIIKLDPTAQTILYAVAVGGSLDDLIHAMAVRSDGTVFVAGETYSSNLPVTGAAQVTLLGSDNAFAAELNPSGAIVYCTYIGGSASDAAWGIAVDSGGSAWVVGSTTSTNFPLASPLQSQLSGSQEAFVVRLAANGASFLFSTYFGGSGGGEGVPEYATSVALDSSGNAYVAGVTSSADFPVLNAWQPEFAGWNSDAFLSSFTPAGTLRFSTYLGGADFDLASSVAILPNGSILLGGYTLSSDFPVTTTTVPWDAGGYNGFVTVFDSLAMNLLYSTYVNQGASDSIFGVAGGSSPAAVGITTPQDAPSTTLATAAQLTIPPLPSQLDPTSATASAAGGSGGSTGVSAPTGYAWVAQSNVAWLAILSGSSGTGNGTVGYSVAANTSTSSRIGTLTIAGQTFTVTQAGAALLSVTSTHTGSFAQGQNGATYTVTVSNAALVGPTAGSVTVTDTLPAGMTLVSMTGTGWSCVANTCSRSDVLGPGASYPVITVTVNVAGNAVSPQMNSVSVSGGGSAGSGATDSTVITPAPPVNVSVTPSSGAGTVQTFAFTVSSAAGWQNIAWIQIFIGNSSSPANCYMDYTAINNYLYLGTNSGGGWIGAGTVGTSGTIQNSQCQIDLATSSLSGSGGNFTLNLAITFLSGLSGMQQIYMATGDNAGLIAAWQRMGAWMVGSVTAPPLNVSVTPSSGTGTAQTFAFTVSSAAGWQNIAWIQISIGNSASPANCYLEYTGVNDYVYLNNNSGGGWIGYGTVGESGTIQNSQCQINLSASSVIGSGNDFTLTLAVTFLSGLSGVQQIFMATGDNAGLIAAWQRMGGWTVGSVTAPPVNVSVTPSSGTGTAQTFAFMVSSAAGWQNIAWIQISIGNSATPADCYLEYTAVNSHVYLNNNSGGGWIGYGTVGESGAIHNSQCQLNLAASSSVGSGNNSTLNLPIAFLSGLSGPQQVYMATGDNAGQVASWQRMGTWTVGSVSAPPVNVSVTPPSGTGTAQTFAFTASSPAGWQNIAWMQISIGNSASPANCYVDYTAINNYVYLNNNSGGGWIGYGTVGSTGTVENSQCQINLAASSAVGSGNDLTLRLAVTFLSGLSGPQQVYMAAGDNAGQVASWQRMGTWTVN
jgi:uncharacterized repeat protein (TIGR01451 family)